MIEKLKIKTIPMMHRYAKNQRRHQGSQRRRIRRRGSRSNIRNRRTVRRRRKLLNIGERGVAIVGDRVTNKKKGGKKTSLALALLLAYLSSLSRNLIWSHRWIASSASEIGQINSGLFGGIRAHSRAIKACEFARIRQINLRGSDEFARNPGKILRRIRGNSPKTHSANSANFHERCEFRRIRESARTNIYSANSHEFGDF